MKLAKKSALSVLLIFLAVTAANASDRSHPAIPPGVQVQVRMLDSLNSGTARVGQPFHGTLQAPILVNGRVLYPKGSTVTGTVVACHRSGRLSDPGVLDLALTSVHNGVMSSGLHTQLIQIKGESHTKSNLEKIGGGAAAGAIIGALAGGGKGAAIGAAVGTAGGTGVAAATGHKEAHVPSEAVLAWVTAAQAPPVMASPPPPQQQYSAPPPPAPEPTYVRRDREDDDDDRDHDRSEHNFEGYGFSDRDRHIIRSCYREDYSNLPPGLAKKDHLPPGLERQLQRNGTLPPGLQKRVQPLPGECVSQLPRLPGGWMRVVLSGRVMLLDPGNRIIDLFFLAGD